MISTTKLLDGPRHAIFHFYMTGDLGELADTVLIDPQVDITPTCKRMSIEEILYDFAGFDAIIEFDSGLMQDNLIWVLPEGSSNHVDFRCFGGFYDRSGVDGTGKLLITTSGFTTSGDQGSMIIKLRKD